MSEKRFWWLVREITAPAAGLAACGFLVSASCAASWKIPACLFYLAGTMTSILAGGLLKDLGKTPKDVARLNDHVHKWSVFALNGFTAIGCALYLWRHQSEAAVPGLILGTFFTPYVMSSALRIIRPHSFWARFRSVLARTVLITVIIGIMWEPGYYLIPLCAIPFITHAWHHLRRDQRRFGWANR